MALRELQIKDATATEHLGRQCFRFRVDNVLLAPTRAEVGDGGVVLTGAGYNDLWLSVALVPADDPAGRTLVRTFRYREARYPLGGVKLPVDGVIRVAPQDFAEGCPAP